MKRLESITRQITPTSGSQGDMEDLFRPVTKKNGSGCAPSSCNNCSPATANKTAGKVGHHDLLPPEHNGEFPKSKIHSASDYLASLKGRNLKVYLFGKQIDNPSEHPIIWPSVNAVAETFRLAEREPDVATAKSRISGMQVSRFLHVTETAADVVAQSVMQRKLGQLTGTCFQRCVGMDAINSTFSVTYDVDAKHNTSYHKRFTSFLKHMHSEGYVLGGAMTDPKGDRGKAPSSQHDLDLYLRVVQRTVDGVIVRGAKMHQTGCLNSHWLIILPGTRLQANEKDFAIACAIPVTAKGITYIYGRQSCDGRANEEGEIDQGNAQFGGQEAIVIFEDVFVPNSHIFLNGETEFATDLVERFTAYHRRSYICKAGVGDVLIGASALVSDYHGTSNASHIKDKLVEMVYLNENIAGMALAASHRSTRTKSGNFQPDVLLANVCKHNVTRFPYEIARLSQDIAGGLVVTLPSHQDFIHSEIGPKLYKYLATKKDVSVDDRRKVLRLIENMTMGRNAVGYLTESMHGAGSPQAQRVLIARLSALEEKKKMAKRIAKIDL